MFTPTFKLHEYFITIWKEFINYLNNKFSTEITMISFKIGKDNQTFTPYAIKLFINNEWTEITYNSCGTYYRIFYEFLKLPQYFYCYFYETGTEFVEIKTSLDKQIFLW